MEIRHFVTFKAIVEQGSFIKASQVLNYAQSSVTSHIQAIEDFYGQPIFDRIGKRVSLNSFGELVYKRACILLASYDDICQLKGGGSKPVGTLRIGSPESTMLYRLSPVLKRYKELYPQVEIVMKSATCQEIRESLRQGELDLAILLEQEISEPDLETFTVFEEPMSIVLPKEYPADDLVVTNKHVILYTEQGCSYRAIFQKLLREKGLQTDNVIETASVEVIKKYVLCNMGISFLPTVVIQKELDGELLKHTSWGTEHPVMIQLAYHKNKWVSPAMRIFIQNVITESEQWL